jgi:hypothetical protein
MDLMSVKQKSARARICGSLPDLEETGGKSV